MGSRFEAAPGKDVDDGGIGEEVVVAEGLVLGPEEEAKGKVGIVLEEERYLGKVIWMEAVGVERVEVAPPGLRALLGED